MTMPIRFFDGYDTLDSSHDSTKWTSGGPVSAGSPGRFGYGQFASVSGPLRRTLTGGPFKYMACGFAVKWTGISGTSPLCLFGSGQAHVSLKRDSSGFLFVTDGSQATHGSPYTGQVLSAEVWYPIGFAAKWDSTGQGQVRVWLDGHLIEELSFDDIDTDNQISSPTDEFTHIDMASPWDDLWVSANDTITGTLEDEYLGDLVVRESFPISDGEHTDWTPFTGSTRYENIDEVGPDDDDSYDHSNTTGHRMCFGVTPATADITSIKAVQLNTVARYDTTGPHDIRNYVREVGIGNHDSAAQPITVSYLNYWDVLENDPVTSGPWSVSNFNARQFGVELDL